MDRLSRGATLVGFPSGGPTHPDAGDSVAALALLHEFGSPANKIPARPFNRMTILRTRKALAELRSILYQQFLKGTIDAKTYLAQIGEWYAGQLKLRISHGTFAPLSPVTIARKKSTRPLLDTAFMRNSVTHREVGL